MEDINAKKFYGTIEKLSGCEFVAHGGDRFVIASINKGNENEEIYICDLGE